MNAITPHDQGLKFAYWVPNVSGGLVISDIEQRTGWDLDYNIKLARIARTAASTMRSARSALPPVTAPNTSMNRSPFRTR